MDGSSPIKPDQLPLFEQSPLFGDKKHPLNLIAYMGDELKRFRRNHPNVEARSASGFINCVLNKYSSEPIGRNRLARVEDGNLKVDFSVYAAYFSEMNIWPDIIHAMQFGSEPTARYLHFIKGELKSDISQGRTVANTNIQNRILREKERQ